MYSSLDGRQHMILDSYEKLFKMYILAHFSLDDILMGYFRLQHYFLMYDI